MGERYSKSECSPWNVRLPLYIYRPQTKFVKVMFLHMSVILSTEGSRYTPRTRYTPRPGTPPLDQVNLPRPGTPPSGPGTPPGPGTLPRPGTPPQDQVHPLGPGTPPGAVHAGRYGQQAGGTHPTGMHSC